MKDEKIQTGLRIPQARYEELRNLAEKAGISLNVLILLLVDIGLSAVNRSVAEAAHSVPHNLQHISE